MKWIKKYIFMPKWLWIYNFLRSLFKLRGRLQTTLTHFCLFLSTYVDIFYLINVDKNQICLDYKPPYSCQRSLWMTPKDLNAYYLVFLLAFAPFSSFLTSVSAGARDFSLVILHFLKFFLVSISIIFTVRAGFSNTSCLFRTWTAGPRLFHNRSYYWLL